MPTPSRNAARLVVHTPARAIIRMSTSGSSLESSRRTHPVSSAAPAPSRPSMRAEVSVHTLASLTATSSAARPAIISTAARRSIRPGVRTGDGGTQRTSPDPSPASSPSGSQNSQRQPTAATTGPAMTSPSPAPIPSSDETTPIAPGIWSRSSSSRSTPKASGNTAPPAPWATRPASITDRHGASAHTSVPAPSVATTIRSIRSLPCMSPRRPSVGVSSAVASRLTVSIHVPLDGAQPSAWSMRGRAGTTAAWATANTAPTRARTATVRSRR